MMLFESVSRVYFSHGINCIAVGLSLFQLNRDKILRSVKNDCKESNCQKGIIMNRDAKTNNKC